jgi:amphiphysin
MATEQWGKALYPFAAQAENQLTFNADDEIKLVPGGELGDWLTGVIAGKKGYVPANYVKIFKKAVIPGIQLAAK